MRGANIISRRFIAVPGSFLGIALLLSGCTAPPRADGLYFRPPATSAVESVASTLSPDQLAQSLRAAGYQDVRVMQGGMVRLRSEQPDFVDCGDMIQVARGNEAEFPGTAPRAVLISGFSPPGLYQRTVRISSEVRLTPVADGGYAVDETHRVTQRIVALDRKGQTTETITFDETSPAVFRDNTSCRSAGRIGAILG